MIVKYMLSLLATIPFLPVMYVQGKAIKKKVPKLPPAKSPSGYVDRNATSTMSILGIGESTMAGVGINHHADGMLAAMSVTLSRSWKVNINWDIYAESGYNVKRINDEVIPIIPHRIVDLIVVAVGGNDAFDLATPWVFRQEIGRLIRLLQSAQPGVPIVFTNMPPIRNFPAFTPLIRRVIGGLVEIHGEVISGLIENYENVYFNSEIITLDSWADRLGIDMNEGDYFSDGVHPSALTYKTWGEAMADYIVERQLVAT